MAYESASSVPSAFSSDDPTPTLQSFAAAFSAAPSASAFQTISGGSGHETIFGSSSPVDSVGGGTGGNAIQGASEKFGAAPSDSIFGGSTHDTSSTDPAGTGAIPGSSTDHVTTITFDGGQTSQVENVKIVFNDHSKLH